MIVVERYLIIIFGKLLLPYPFAMYFKEDRICGDACLIKHIDFDPDVVEAFQETSA